MIPASYLYKNVYTRSWGDPHNMQPEAVEEPPRGPDSGHRPGLSGLAARLGPFLPIRIERRRHIRPA